MLKFTDDGRLIDPGMAFFGIGEALTAIIAEAGTAIGSAATTVGSAVGSAAGSLGLGGASAGATAADLAAAGTAAGETVTVTAPSLAAGLDLGALAPAAAGGLALAAPSLAGTGAATGATGGIAGGASPTPATSPNPLSTAPQPLSPTTSPTASAGPTGGPGASAAGSAPPPGIGPTSPDVTQIQPPAGGGSGSGGLPTQNFDSGVTASQPGQVGSGAASGAPSNVSAVNTPSSIGPASSPVSPAGGGDISPVTVTPQNASIPAASAPETSVGKFIANPGISSGLNVIGENPSTALGVAGLGADLLMGQQKPPGYSNILSTANQLSGQSAQLESYLNNGTLPPGVQNSLNAAEKAAEASIRSQQASRGGTSSAEAQDISNARIAEAGQGAGIAEQLYTQGVSESQISAQLYGQIMNTAMQQDAELSNAFGNFAYAMAGGQRPLTPQNTGTL